MRGQKLIRTKVMVAALALTTLLPCTIGVAFSEDAQPAANNQPTGPAANNHSHSQHSRRRRRVTILNDHEVESILGREVVSSASEDMGRIVDVLVDRRGQVRAAIIDFGGFLGVGSRKIAVDWSALQFPPPGKTDAKITLEFTRDQVKAAPEYQEGKPIVVLSALGKLEPLPE